MAWNCQKCGFTWGRFPHSSKASFANTRNQKLNSGCASTHFVTMESVLSFLDDKNVQDVINALTLMKVPPEKMRWNKFLLTTAREKGAFLVADFINDAEAPLVNIRDKPLTHITRRPQGMRLYACCSGFRRDVAQYVQHAISVRPSMSSPAIE